MTCPCEACLRDVRLTNANGFATFTTVFPGGYSGRWLHIVFGNETSAQLAVMTPTFAGKANAQAAVATVGLAR